MGEQKCSPFLEAEKVGILRDKKITVATSLALCVITGVAGTFIGQAAFGWKNRGLQSKLKEIDRLVTDKYVGELDTGQVADYAAIGYIAGVGDKWSSYISADDYKGYMLRNEGKSCGIGVSIVTAADSIQVSAVYDGSPAAEAGIERMDYIIGAEGLTVEKDGASAVVEAVQGEEGEAVNVTVKKYKTGVIEELAMVRAVVEQKMAWGEALGDGTGYIRIENFHVGSAGQFKNALDSLTAENIKGLVIDVRHNGGGRVKEMSEMLDLFLPEGIIMTLTTKDGHNTVYSSDADMIDLPLAVLIDEQSISAAEFFAAALQEYERAVLVGAHTTGKGRAQQTFQLSDGSAVNLSVEQYYTPKGNSLADVGIAPDEEAELTDEQKAGFYFLEPEDDTQRKRAVELVLEAVGKLQN